MSEATQGSTVHVHYTGRTEEGVVFDSSADRDPLSFELGAGRVIPGFESAVDGMQVGEEKTVTIPSTDAYGPHREDLIHEVGRAQLPPDLSPEVGQHLHLRTPDGQTMQVQVVQVGEESIQLDANHPLAGKDLTFEIELVGVE